MSATDEPTSGRAALANQLGTLHAKLREQGKTQKSAVEEANRRRRIAGDRAPGEPWPRRDGGLDLSVKTVNDWFPKRNASKTPSLPTDFEDLWAVVGVMLGWTGQFTDERSAERQRCAWKALYADAQRGSGLSEDVRVYLEAAREAARKHPHPGINLLDPPSLADVYVRQHSKPAAVDAHASALCDVPAVTTGGTGPSVPAEPAETMLRKADRMCVLIAGPGGGKSSLLRTRLRDVADKWLNGTEHAATAGTGVPIWVSARAFVGEETQVPDALAAATRKLSRYGRQPGLDRARFLERPCAGVHWQLLVDDLDELPNRAERQAVLEKLAHAVAAEPPLYRCVVATRPLTDNDLDVLDRVFGWQVPCYDLQPFTADDLYTYTESYFGTRWPKEEAARRAQHFTGALRSASLADLARTPLMAFMLCQLYFARRDRPLPAGRTEVYDAFTDLLYESNHSKRIAASHEGAIQHLVQSLQSPRARRETDEAAQQVHQRLPELIDYLAYQWLTGHQAPATLVLASHEDVRRPAKVSPERWDAFLEDLLRHTGLLVHYADGLGFPHQTFLEYHAARHATRDKQARTELLAQLFPASLPLHVPTFEPSYLGFLLDALFASPDDTARETISRIETLTCRGGTSACDFLVKQVALKTNLATEPTARQLTRFAQNRDLHGYDRVRAAVVLAGMDGCREAGMGRLIALADDPSVDDVNRLRAAVVLAGEAGCPEAGANSLIVLADAPSVDTAVRVRAAVVLAGMDGCREAGMGRLIVLADDPSVDDHARVLAAEGLVEVDGCREAGMGRLIVLADDPSVDDHARVLAAEGLVEVDGCREVGMGRLIVLADDPSVDNQPRVWAATAIAHADRDRGASLYARLANDPTLMEGRVQAAKALARLDGCQEAGTNWLIALADSPTLWFYRMNAAEAFAEVEGDQIRVADLYARLASDPTHWVHGRVQAAQILARIEGYREVAANRLIALADDATLEGRDRMEAADALAGIEGYRELGINLLTALINGSARGSMG
ncbi:NACHT domain-containing protein [Streptomyces sp. NPDC088747]|uniref:NACHT domain-containing protein n=1 Tax=Streptomyces sp. NPDC088747 TaxID=3365886 RepID=UPI003800E7D6